MEIKNREDVEFVDDTCGTIQELYHSDNLSVAYVVVTGKAKSHMHKVMEEIYYVEKGRGKLYVGEECYQLRPGDIIPVPKNIYHHLEKTFDEDLEVMVITHPKYDISDVIEEKPNPKV